MPLDTSSYSLAHLRLDGRRWNELRRLYAQISTQASADGSSYLEMGNTKVICTVTGPAESVSKQGRGAGGGGGGGSEAQVVVEIGIAGFSGVDRKRRARGDKYVCLLFLIVHLRYELIVFSKQAYYRNADKHIKYLSKYPFHTPLSTFNSLHISFCPLTRRFSTLLLCKCLHACTHRRWYSHV